MISFDKTMNHKLEDIKKEKQKIEKMLEKQKTEAMVTKYCKDKKRINLSSEKERNYEIDIKENTDSD